MNPGFYPVAQADFQPQEFMPQEAENIDSYDDFLLAQNMNCEAKLEDEAAEYAYLKAVLAQKGK
jgi:hypothetical protein